MQLPELARSLGADSADLPAVEVRAATHASGWVQPGDVFVALRGVTTDGHRFLADAVQRGAVAVIGEGLPEGVECAVPYVRVEHGRRALAKASAALTGYPARGLRVVGVTGTDGKTTTSTLTLHLLRAAGLPAGFISTIGYQLPDGELRQPPQHFTTPEAPQVQQILRDMVGQGAQAAVVESSSHALVLERVGAIEFEVGVWTQLTQEHLDFHGTVENYFAAKRTLIERSRFAVLNADDPWTAQLRGIAPEETTYSALGAEADWRALDVRESARGLEFHVVSPLGEIDVELPMIGRFNVANALAAMAAAARLGATLEQLRDGLGSFAGVLGRMQLVPATDDDPRVIVDFAHTPPSLEKALHTLRATTTGELWVVIGSAGGNRDPGKRFPLGEVSARLADHAIFTEEDYRDTPLRDILDEMERGARSTGRANFRSIGDRREAIRTAIREARPGDTVMLAGKGPEEVLERGSGDIPWDETAEAAEALRLRG